jgi:hypothetical protein
VRELFERDEERVLEYITVEFLDAIALVVREDVGLSEEVFFAVSQICQESPRELAGRLFMSELFDTAVTAIRTAPFRGAGAASLLMLEVLRSRNEPAVARAYYDGFDTAIRLLMESDVQGWRAEAAEALCELIHFLDETGHSDVIEEIATKDWLIAAIQEVVENDGPRCLKNSCRFLVGEFTRRLEMVAKPI